MRNYKLNQKKKKKQNKEVQKMRLIHEWMQYTIYTQEVKES